MVRSRRGSLFVVLVSAALGIGAMGELQAQAVANNPYHAIHGWEKLPDGMKIGVPSGVYPDPDGRHIWILSRCGANHCANSEQDPILKLDLEGNLVKSFGGGMFSFPHGFFLDQEGYLWVTEGAPAGDAREVEGLKRGLGHQVFKLDQDGNVVMTLGEAGVSGYGPDHFNGPSGVTVAPNGDIWVADGHRGGNNRIVKFSKEGDFLLEVGGGVEALSGDPGKFNDPHDISIDARGRVLVADRGNNRVQIFDQEGNLLKVWTQFGRPSVVFVDGNDVVYVGDGMSDENWNPGWERGIRIGDVETGWVSSFIPDSEAPTGTGVEFLGVDLEGNIYAGEVGRQRLVKYSRFRP
jgi:DNA-binding beta-propeller fold protein YncE